jgi:hypothetical protein
MWDPSRHPQARRVVVEKSSRSRGGSPGGCRWLPVAGPCAAPGYVGRVHGGCDGGGGRYRAADGAAETPQRRGSRDHVCSAACHEHRPVMAAAAAGTFCAVCQDPWEGVLSKRADGTAWKGGRSRRGSQPRWHDPHTPCHGADAKCATAAECARANCAGQRYYADGDSGLLSAEISCSRL